MASNHIGRTLSGGVMVLCMILLFTPQTYSQSHVKITVQTFTISGKVGEPGVTMQGFPESPAPVTDENGVYSVQVKYNWSGNVTPVKPGYTFEPKGRAYSATTEDKTNEDYTATLQTFTIAGTTDKPGVKLRGLPEDPNSDKDGRYSVKVPFGWSGTVTPELEGFRFEPPSRDYSQIMDDKKNDSYVARVQTFVISGSAGAEGVLMKGFPGDVKTAKDGTYRVEVPYKWSGKVTPDKEGHEFMPEARDYSNVTDVYANEDYVARVFNYEISGTAGMAGVVMAGLPGEPITDLDGRYTATVEHGWSGKITPTKAGYGFKPPVIDIAKVTEKKPNQDFTASIMKYTISGTTGVGMVKLTGLPTELISGATGSYAVTVEFGWTGSITPDKEGYTFEPGTLFLGPIEKDLAKQDFKAKPVTSTISGNVGLSGVLMQGLPGRVTSGPDGAYSVDVPFKWSGTVTPMKDGYTFEPANIEYKDVRESATTENYVAMVKQYTVSGRVMSDKGPLADVFIMTDKTGVSAMTDASGEFKLTVEHTWTGKITPQKDGCTFTPNLKPVGPVTQNLTNQSFVGKMRMITITDSIMMGDEPIQGVTITAKPGDYAVTTDARGRYTIQVPYNWTGELFMAKPGIVFEPESILYQNVTENIDNVSPKTPPGPVTPGPVTPGPATPGPATPGPAAPIGSAAVEKAKLEQQIALLRTQLDATTGRVEKDSLERQIATFRTQLDALSKMPTEPNELTTVPKDTRIAPPVVPSDVQSNQGPIVSGTFAGTVLEVLTQISAKTGAKVYADATVKPDPIQPVTITAMPMSSALPMILKGTKYTFRRIEKPEEAYQVFLPIQNTFAGDDLRRALQDISATAGIAIVPDETVAGQVFADIQGVPLEVALETILAGTSYVTKKTANYYLVADRKPEGSAFDKISETRRVRLNYITPSAAKSLLSTAFTPYVQAEVDPNSHMVTVTAPTALTERIVGEIKDMDIRPRHVLLDARIVAMERGDLLNIGIEWGMPTAQAGFFGDSYQRGTLATGEADPAGNWPWGVSVGLSFDRTFTNSLNAALNMLKENSKVDILSSPQVVGRDGKRSRIQIITEEYFMMSAPVNQNLFYSQSQLETVKSGTTLEITPLIGDNNDITLELAVEVSDSIPRGRGSDLPVVTRRTSQNFVTIRDGGTVAVAGLTENRTREKEKRVPFFSDIPGIGRLFRNNDSDKATREIAVFVTARLVPETSVLTGQLPGPPEGGRILSPAGDSFRQELKDSLSR